MTEPNKLIQPIPSIITSSSGKQTFSTTFTFTMSLDDTPIKHDKTKPDILIPNYVIGYRAWRLLHHSFNNSYELWSLNSTHLWPYKKPFGANCHNGNVIGDTSNTPNRICSCGVYAYKYPSMVYSHTESLQSSTYVVGQVAMWGHTIQHRIGYRSEFAYPLRLFIVPNQSDDVLVTPKDLFAYGVPVDYFNHFKFTALNPSEFPYDR